jgi:Asp/Glu/hydantoin racemase
VSKGHSPGHPAGFKLGVVMLKTRFPRLEGDVGNPASFPFPTLYREVEAATVSTVVVAGEIEPQVAQGILDAAVALGRSGASLIATSCGFLGALQDRLRRATGVPVVASSLVLLPFLRALYGAGRPIGILTFDSTRLTPRHFGPWHGPDLVVEGVEQGVELHRVVSRDLPEMDRDRAERDVVESARRLLDRQADTAALVLECTNFSPYRARVAAATGLPVYDLVQAVTWQAQAMGWRPSA